MAPRHYLAIVDIGCGILLPIRSGPVPRRTAEAIPGEPSEPDALLKDALAEPSRIVLWLEADPAEDSA